LFSFGRPPGPFSDEREEEEESTFFHLSSLWLHGFQSSPFFSCSREEGEREQKRFFPPSYSSVGSPSPFAGVQAERRGGRLLVVCLDLFSFFSTLQAHTPYFFLSPEKKRRLERELPSVPRTVFLSPPPRVAIDSKLGKEGIWLKAKTFFSLSILHKKAHPFFSSPAKTPK